MKKNYFIMMLGVGQLFSSQVGIGTTTPHQSAALDIDKSNKGILIPRVSLSGKNDITTITNPANGLLVFNTNNGNNSTVNTTADDVIAGNFYSFSTANNSWDLLVNNTVLDQAIEGLGVPRLQVIATVDPTGNDISYIGSDLGSNIRKLFFPVKKYDRNNSYNALTSEFTAPLTGYYQIEASLLLKSYQAQSSTNVTRLGVSKPYTNFVYNGNATFAFLNQPINPVISDTEPLTLKVSGVIFIQKDQKICFLTRYITPGNTAGNNIYSMNTENIGFDRANVNNMVITYFPFTN